MSRADDDRLRDIAAACVAIVSYRHRETADADIVVDAIRVRLIEIGEAVKVIDPQVLSREPEIPWAEISRMRDHLTHRYFDTAHSMVSATADTDVPLLAAAVERLLRKTQQVTA